MSEKLQHSGEHSRETIDASAEARKNLERLQEKAEQAEQDPLQKHVESLRETIESQAISGKEVSAGDHNTEQSAQQFGISKELKTDTYKKTLKQVRKHLSAPDRVLSRFVHTPAVEVTSQALGKTVARPSSFFGGSLGALLGSVVLVVLARRNGFEYNYAAFFFLFIGGFIVGSIIELLFRLLFRRKSI